ncbi:DUF6875 domain-containing protein [Nonomuraea sp. NPDC050663]|uniref:DUF6875 domain-containing protein n=1 Tax=Nonomuraea sp. NPDC050663 TaxID=3364370 RepID=UPI0037A5CD0A
MITHPTDPSLMLFDPADVEADEPPHPLVRQYATELRAVVAWAHEYLCRPHPDLGRRGPVCPYTQASLERGLFRLAVEPGHDAGSPGVMDPYREWFTSLAPPGRADSVHAAILVLLPGMAGRLELIDEAQRLLKDTYVADGLMIGEFHPGPPPKAGLWNPGFRALHAPVPMLVIRHMVATDLPFLAGDPAHLEAYQARFGDQIPGRLRDAFPAAVVGER